MKPVILFVDDEPNILRGLKRLLHSRRESWDMAFMEGGEAAIDWLSENHVDAIVSDMRMPRVDGADVLNYAARNSKGSVRLVLSGEADRDLTYRTIGCSHQFLSKPCDEVKLVRAIETPLALTKELPTEQLAAVSAACSTPVCPTRTHAALDAAFADADQAALTAIVASDPGLALRALQLANSAYFGRPANTLSIADAIGAVGMDVFADLHHAGRLASIPTDAGADDAVAKTADLAAEASRELAAIAMTDYNASEAEAETAYAAGLVSWVGESLAASSHMRDERVPLSPLNAASYAACLLGLPLHICASVQALAKADAPTDTPLARAESLAALLFEKAAA